MLITSSWIMDMFILFVTMMILLYKYVTRKFKYWKQKGIHYVEPIPFFGNILEVCTFKTAMSTWFQNVYNSTNEPYFGIFVFDQPYLVLRSAEIIRHVLVKDFSYFTDRTVAAPKHSELISNMMFFQKSPEWKLIRPKMTPMFTAGKLKGMFSILDNVGAEMNQYILKHLGQLEAKELSAKFSVDIIAKCAFAINANSFVKEDADFRTAARSAFDFRWRTAIVQSSYFFLQGLVDLLHLNFVEKRISTFLKDIFWQAIKTRESSNIKGNDLIDQIVDMRKDKGMREEIKFEGDKVVAQAVQIFLAGFETTSSAISFTLYELCVHPRIQTKLRNEIFSVIKKHGGLTYDSLQDMKYLDMCVKETLRKYPALPFLDRRCNADYKIPNTNITIEKGTPIFIPLMGLHRDKQYFPDPEKYEPERFLEKNSYNVNGLYYLPFGEGPRNCIGVRFGLTGTKVAIAHILLEFEIERTKDTPVPVEFAAKSFMVQSKVGLPMKFKKFGADPA